MTIKEEWEDRKRFLLYSLYGWGLPILIISIIAVFKHCNFVSKAFQPLFGDAKCLMYSGVLQFFLSLLKPRTFSVSFLFFFRAWKLFKIVVFRIANNRIKNLRRCLIHKNQRALHGGEKCDNKYER